MFAESYSDVVQFHNGHILQEQKKLVVNGELVYLKNKDIANGNKNEMVYKNPKYFRKTQKKRVHFEKKNSASLDDSRGMPILPMDSYLLYKKKTPVKSKKNRRTSSQKHKYKSK